MKYFVISDVHGFFSLMKEALDEAGYDPHNPDHFLISCGDLFDRGNEAAALLDYVTSLPKDRCAFVRGNHDLALQELVRGNRGWNRANIHNGTLDTIVQLFSISSYYEFTQAKYVLGENENCKSISHPLSGIMRRKTMCLCMDGCRK